MAIVSVEGHRHWFLFPKCHRLEVLSTLTVPTRAGQLVCAVVLTRLVRHTLLGHPQEVPNLQLADLELDTCVLEGTEWRRRDRIMYVCTYVHK